MKLFTVIFISISIFSEIEAQQLAIYTDYRDRVYVFDDGKNIKVEDLKIQSYDIGGECILYINSMGHLKMYREGIVTKLEAGSVLRYRATDHLAVYSIFEKLKVVQNGVPVTLTMRCLAYQVQDSLIVFYDKSLESLRVYYDSNLEDIESGLVGNPINKLTSGDNIIAYVSSRTNDFKIYYNGENNTILQNVESFGFGPGGGFKTGGQINKGFEFKAGKDIVAFINPLDNTFHAFYKGDLYQLDNFPPKSFKTADGFVAYIDYTDAFKVFYKGRIIEISSFAPEGYFAEDKILAFNENEYFKAFYNGEIFEVEGYIPRDYRVDWNTIAYLDNTNRIWLFTKGERRFLTNDLINNFELVRDLIIMNVKVNRNVIYYDSEFYEGMSE
ncbi:MAG: hypothetical protein JW894_11520 [Bacteroidales bacterium]|nr:hypothetical protein [Bacteroidales bacterium]